METQTRTVRATEALGRARRGAETRDGEERRVVFQRLYAENAERMAAKDAIDATVAAGS